MAITYKSKLLKKKSYNYKKCRYCGKSFNRKTVNQRYCNPWCKYRAKCRAANEHVKSNKSKAPMITKVCKYCGSLFNTKISCKIYCDPECQVKAMKIGHRITDSKTVTRWEIFNRDNFTCQYCGRNVMEDKVKLEVDHVKPRIDNGLDNKDNLITACQQCNHEKGTKPLRFEADFKRRLSCKFGQAKD